MVSRSPIVFDTDKPKLLDDGDTIPTCALPTATRSALGGVMPTRYVTVDSKGHIDVDPSLIARLVITEARLARYQVDFLAGTYTVNSAPATLSQAVPAGAANRDADGRLLVQRGTTNLLANPTFAGAKLGRYDQGGVFPTGWERSIAGIPWQIIAIEPSKIRIRFWRDQGGPTPATSFGVRMPYTATPAPSRGGLTASGQLRVVSSTDNFSSNFLQVNNNTTGATGFSAQFIADDVLRSYSTYVAASVGDSLYYRLQFSLTGATADIDPFEIILDLYHPQLEDGKSPLDYTVYVAGTRAAYDTTLAIPIGIAQAATLQSNDRGDWYKPFAPSGSTWVVTPPDIGYLAIEKIYSMDDNDVSVARETEFSTTLFPPQFEQQYITTDSIDQSGFRWTVQGAKGLDYSYLRGGNKKQLERFAVRQGDAGWWETSVVDRSELSCQSAIDYDREFWVSCGLFIEPGVVNDTSWVSLMQFHGNPQPTDENYSSKLSWSPCFTLDFRQDVLTIATRSESTVDSSGRPVEVIRYHDPLYARGVMQYWVMRFVISRTGNGQMQIWRNGRELLNLAIPNGYNDALGPSPKYGIYRGRVPPPLAVQFANA